jgi:hypothetical protein
MHVGRMMSHLYSNDAHTPKNRVLLRLLFMSPDRIHFHLLLSLMRTITMSRRGSDDESETEAKVIIVIGIVSLRW